MYLSTTIIPHVGTYKLRLLYKQIINENCSNRKYVFIGEVLTGQKQCRWINNKQYPYIFQYLLTVTFIECTNNKVCTFNYANNTRKCAFSYILMRTDMQLGMDPSLLKVPIKHVLLWTIRHFSIRSSRSEPLIMMDPAPDILLHL